METLATPGTFGGGHLTALSQTDDTLFPGRFLPFDPEIGLLSLPGTEPGQSSLPEKASASKGTRRNLAQALVTPALGQQRVQLHAAGPSHAPVPCWPPCTGKSTAACHSCPRKPWVQSSRYSRGRQGLQERHSRMKQGDRHCLAGSSMSCQPYTCLALPGVHIFITKQSLFVSPL